jgi:flagellar basal body rod protein FlgG
MLGDMDGMDWMASAMRAAQAQLETATHNLANVASDGFRRVRSSITLTGQGLVARESPDNAQGGIRETGRTLDLALLGPGAFHVGGSETRNGAFIRDRDGYLADQQGRRVEGRAGPIRLSENATVESNGTIRDGDRVVGRLPLPPGTTLRSGALESSSVDAIGETLAILTAQRAFETAQKTLVAIDQTREKAVNDVVRLK